MILVSPTVKRRSANEPELEPMDEVIHSWPPLAVEQDRVHNVVPCPEGEDSSLQVSSQFGEQPEDSPRDALRDSLVYLLAVGSCSDDLDQLPLWEASDVLREILELCDIG